MASEKVTENQYIQNITADFAQSSTTKKLDSEEKLNTQNAIPSITTFDELKKLSVGSHIGNLIFLGISKSKEGTDVASFDGTFTAQGTLTSNAQKIYFEVANIDQQYQSLFEMYTEKFNTQFAPLLVSGLDAHPAYSKIGYDDGSRSATTTIVVSGLKIYDPQVSNWYYETQFVSLKNKLYLQVKEISPYSKGPDKVVHQEISEIYISNGQATTSLGKFTGYCNNEDNAHNPVVLTPELRKFILTSDQIISQITCDIASDNNGVGYNDEIILYLPIGYKTESDFSVLSYKTTGYEGYISSSTITILK